MSRDARKNQNNLINSGSQANSKDLIITSENDQQMDDFQNTQISQDSLNLSFLNGKLFEFIKLFVLLIIIIILILELKYVMNIYDRKKKEIKNLTDIFNYYNYNSAWNVIPSTIIIPEMPKTSIYNNYSNHTTNTISTINDNNNPTNKINTTSIITTIGTKLKISTTNIINTLYTTNIINIINSTNIKNNPTIINGTTIVNESKEKEYYNTTTIKTYINDNIDIDNNYSTIITNFNCSSGYYLSYDINGNKQCKKCHIENCNNCTDDGICKLCESNFLPFYENEIIISCEYPCKDDPEDKCLSCDNDDKCKLCNIGYKLVDGMCLINHSIKAIYYSQEENNIIHLINNAYEKYILEMIVDDNNITPTYNYTFQDKGDHTVYFLINNNISSLKNMFSEIYDITAITFTKIFNTENIKDMSEMFANCNSLTYIDISHFNTQNVQNIDSMFYNCENLISINLSNFNTKNVIYMGYLFSFCSKIEYIDISNFNTQNVIDMGSMFCDCLSLTSIEVSKFNTKNVRDMSLYVF